MRKDICCYLNNKILSRFDGEMELFVTIMLKY